MKIDLDLIAQAEELVLDKEYFYLASEIRVDGYDPWIYFGVGVRKFTGLNKRFVKYLQKEQKLHRTKESVQNVLQALNQLTLDCEIEEEHVRINERYK